jgi:O-phosphoseryl-tRNA(Cys) synthetase
LALLSGRVYNNGWKAQNEEQLRRRIMQKIREVDLVSVQNLMRYIKRKLRAIEDHGPLAII